MTAARNDQEPAPGSSMFVFFPNQPSPARWATGRSASGLLSTKIRLCTGRPTTAGSRSTSARTMSRRTSW